MTITNPVRGISFTDAITSGSFASPTITNPTVTGGTFTSASLVSPAISGDTSSTGRYITAVGTSAAPAYSFTGAENAGMFFSPDGKVAFANGANGATPRLTISSAGVTEAFGTFHASTGSATDMGYGFTLDPDTGMYRASSNVLSLATGGTDRIVIGSAGTINISATVSVTSVQIMSSAGLTAGGLRFDSITSGAGAQTATTLNSPVAGNPTFWIAVNINGTIRYIPAW